MENRAELEDLCRRRFFYRPGSDIYGGVAGFFTYGPPGCALKTNILQQWRRHFVYEEQLQEIEDTCIMLHKVLKASGHVDRFNDFMVKDTKDESRFFRADKLLEEVMKTMIDDPQTSPAQKEEYAKVRNQADGYSADELSEIFQKYNIKAPETGNDLSEPYPFNLMFPVPIGPAGNESGYLRPETAQGMFLNYKYCVKEMGNRLPFGIAQIGKVFRNEIAPRAGLLRTREFQQAEIEWFVKPSEKDHPKFRRVAKMEMKLFSAPMQLEAREPEAFVIGDAVKTKLVHNETLGYFMARTALFVYSIGVNPECVRFRQHLPTEMAHYACDCWDLEIETCYGWVECVGIADRACFDLDAHAGAAKVDLAFREAVSPPIEQESFALKKQAWISVMKFFGKDGAKVKEWLMGLPQDSLVQLSEEAESNGKALRCIGGKEFELKPEHVRIEKVVEKITTREFMPGVIEPSFGIDRLMFSVLEQSFYVREEQSDDKQTRSVLRFPPAIAPYKLVILPLDQRIARNEAYTELLTEVRTVLSSLGIQFSVDDSGATVGRRYSRNDELGVSYAMTVDFDTFDVNGTLYETVTIRERDSMQQIRVKTKDVPYLIQKLCSGRATWEECVSHYGGSGKGDVHSQPDLVGAREIMLPELKTCDIIPPAPQREIVPPGVGKTPSKRDGGKMQPTLGERQRIPRAKLSMKDVKALRNAVDNTRDEMATPILYYMIGNAL